MNSDTDRRSAIWSVVLSMSFGWIIWMTLIFLDGNWGAKLIMGISAMGMQARAIVVTVRLTRELPDPTEGP